MCSIWNAAAPAWPRRTYPAIVAGILSTRGEFIGLPEDIKSYLVKSAIDLGRERSFQGGGLVDMMRTIQAM